MSHNHNKEEEIFKLTWYKIEDRLTDLSESWPRGYYLVANEVDHWITIQVLNVSFGPAQCGVPSSTNLCQRGKWLLEKIGSHRDFMLLVIVNLWKKTSQSLKPKFEFEFGSHRKFQQPAVNGLNSNLAVFLIGLLGNRGFLGVLDTPVITGQDFSPWSGMFKLLQLHWRLGSTGTVSFPCCSWGFISSFQFLLQLSVVSSWFWCHS